MSEKEDLKVLFSTKFKALAQSNQKTNQELAEMFDLSIKAIEKWKNVNPGSGTIPKIEKLLEICDKLGCDMNYLLMDDQEHFDDTYKVISEKLGLSDKAIKGIEAIHNDIDEDISLKTSNIHLRKNLLDYLLSNHPEFVTNMLDLIYELLSWNSYYFGLLEQPIDNRYKGVRERTRDRQDLIIVKITRLMNELISSYDVISFYEESGTEDCYTDHKQRSDKLQELWKSGLIQHFDDIPKELIPYYKGTAEQAEQVINTINKGGK
ncbi:MAG: hypothetical protein K6G43_03745 [Lachnospiraceae bacterium]|nr:hypothetical protein [Lachnospiraceae bacterium]